jgi:hypothetical protein
MERVASDIRANERSGCRRRMAQRDMDWQLRAVIQVYRDLKIVNLFWQTGEWLTNGARRLVAEPRLEDFFEVWAVHAI